MSSSNVVFLTISAMGQITAFRRTYFLFFLVLQFLTLATTLKLSKSVKKSMSSETQALQSIFCFDL